VDEKKPEAEDPKEQQQANNLCNKQAVAKG